MANGVEFSLEQSKLILNENTFTGWSNDTDALDFPDIEFSKQTFGASGNMVSVGTGIKGGPMTLKFLPNSPSVKYIQDLITLRQTLGVITNFSGTFLSNVGVLTTFSNGSLSKGPPGTGMGAGAVKNHVYIITFEKIISEYATATF